ncbi:polysaccharide pyruvyl transferase family protein [Listeria grandensis]|uniref:Pyruvyl-transferase n=1 Tax=Listeria grandensis TaxID=1494963 RepID=A0A7X0Y398_9LIST|nr:polysaccharide pyruvyl transferase family protein [Listeria grandensis]MBC1936237.1 pyruvyl-transferase [Listeria grandensis]MBC6315205.1 pyruvyl-transferase [Listeria grandensis]
MRPIDAFSAEEILTKDRTGYNNGNLAYQYSIFRTLWQDDVELFSDGYFANPNLADGINDTYDAYIIPLADAFREDFRWMLRAYTQLIKRLKIPVYVIGVGLRAPYEAQLGKGFIFDEDVKAFVSAVLEKSGQIGLRGSITADYLTKLGFKEGVDHRVIGCPSLYTFGRELKIRPLNLHKNSPIAINASPVALESSIDFLNKVTAQYNNYNFIPQLYDELFLTYAGGPKVVSEIPNYPTDIKSNYYKEGKVKYFTSMQAWLDEMRQTSFTIGSRLHGNVIATITGTPNISFVQDARMRELAAYHKLPHIVAEELAGYNNLEELLEKIDLYSAETVQTRNFDTYLDFLNYNEIPHIYTTDKNRKDAPLDQLLANVDFPTGVLPITACRSDVIIDRLNKATEIVKERATSKVNLEINKREQQIGMLKKNVSEEQQRLQEERRKLATAEQKINEQEKQLQIKSKRLAETTIQLQEKGKEADYYKRTTERKAARMALKVADVFAKKG